MNLIASNQYVNIFSNRENCSREKTEQIVAAAKVAAASDAKTSEVVGTGSIGAIGGGLTAGLLYGASMAVPGAFVVGVVGLGIGWLLDSATDRSGKAAARASLDVFEAHALHCAPK